MFLLWVNDHFNTTRAAFTVMMTMYGSYNLQVQQTSILSTFDLISIAISEVQ